MIAVWIARASRALTGLVMFAGLMLLATFLEEQGAETVSGSAYVIDGDSLRVGSTEIRLVGIDAPELFQNCRLDGKAWPCGRKAREALVAMSAGRALVCRIEGHDKYARALARCRAGDRDLNAQMVLQGWAVAYGDYDLAEARAARRKAGIWRGDFDLPREHRAGRGIYGWIAALDWPWRWWK